MYTTQPVKESGSPLLYSNTNTPVYADDSAELPVKKRGCTDIIFSIIFIAVLIYYFINTAQYFDLDLAFKPKTTSFKFNDVLKTSLWLCGGFGIAWLILLRYLSGVLVWMLAIVGNGALYVVGFLVYRNPETLKLSSQNAFYLMIIIEIVAIVITLLLILLRNKIKLTIGLLKNSVSAFTSVPSVVFVSVIVAAIMICAILYGVVVNINAVTALSAGDSAKFVIFVVFVTAWIGFFLSGLLQLSIGGGIGHWYFTKDRTMGTPGCFRYLFFGLTLHLGTIAVGSLILAILFTIRFIVNKAKKSAKAKGNKIGACLLGCIACCLKCFESLIDWLTSYAYIFVALHGESFISSGKRVTALLKKHFDTAAVNDGLSWFIFTVGNILLGVLTYSVLGKIYEDATTSQRMMGASIVFVFLYALSLMLKRVLQAVFVCFAEDAEDGYKYTPVELRAIIEGSDLVVKDNSV
ncbi:hypothetical protein PCE1_003007 [Barthelona sp. PCE]